MYVTMRAMTRRMHSYYLDPELTEGLDAIRDRDGILPSEQVRRAIALWLKEKGYTASSTPRPRKKGRAKK